MRVSSPMLPAADVADQLQVMRWHETTCYETFDYVQYSALSHATMGDAEGPTNLPVISPQWREVICQWAYKLVDHFAGPRRGVGVAMHFVDRYLCESLCGGSIQASMSKRQFKLLCLACLHLALKLERPNLIPLDMLMSLSRGMFTREELLAVEQLVLKKLQWRLHPPLAQDFLELYALQLQGNQNGASSTMGVGLDFEESVDSARYMLEISVFDYFFVSHRPSHVAAGAFLAALDSGPTFPWNSCSSLYSQLLSSVDPMEIPNIWICKTRIHAMNAHQVMAPQRSVLPSTVSTSLIVPHQQAVSRMVDKGHDHDPNQPVASDDCPSLVSQPPGTWVVSPVDVLNYFPSGSSK